MFLRKTIRMLLCWLWLPIFLAACTPGAAPPPGSPPSYGGNYSLPAASPTSVQPNPSKLAQKLIATQSGSQTETAPEQAVQQAFEKLNTAYPFRTTETTTLAGETTQRIAEYAAPDRVHITIKNGQGSQPNETIRIKDKMYTQQNGQWSESTASASSASSLDLAELLSQGLSAVTLVGPENINGNDTLAYTFKLQIPLGNLTYPGSGEVWIGTADDLPHQVQYHGQVKGNQLDTTLTYEYGVNLQIEAPIP